MPPRPAGNANPIAESKEYIMKFALSVPGLLNYPPAMAPWEVRATGKDIIRFARHADRLSWDWLTVPEHLFMPDGMVEVMGRRFPEGITACAVLAGATERIHMLTYVLVVPYRNPVLLAKQIATMEFIAGGRFTLGAAPGHLKREFEVLGIPFEERGWITDEYIRAMIECWTSDTPTFEGKYVSFKGIVMEPKPVQKPYPPIFIGGNTEIAMKRAVRHGDGWIPWLITTDELRRCIDFMSTQPGWEEKKDRFEIVMPTTEYKVEDYSHAEKGETEIVMDRDRILFELEELQKAGATVAQVMTPPVDAVDQCLEWIEWYDSDIIPNFR